MTRMVACQSPPRYNDPSDGGLNVHGGELMRRFWSYIWLGGLGAVLGAVLSTILDAYAHLAPTQL